LPDAAYLQNPLVFFRAVRLESPIHNGIDKVLCPQRRRTEMSREQKSNKENKKEPAMTAKEKKAAKKAKKEEKGRLGE
jgi:hypothetical protein